LRRLLYAVLLAGCHRPEPPKPPPPEPDPYPLAVGARWKYRSEMGLVVVREVRRALPDGWLEMVFSLPVLGEHDLPMRRTVEGVVARRDGREQLVLRVPFREGDRWRIDFPSEDLADCEVEATEELEVLGEKRPCARVKVTRTNRKSGRATVDTEWYARGIGLARMRVTLGLTQTFVLESYEPGAK
jgi:hypothetical protein